MDQRQHHRPDGAGRGLGRRRGPIEPIPYEIQIDYTEEIYEAVVAAARESISEAMSIADKADRNARIDAVNAEVVAALAGTPDEPGKFEATPVISGRCGRSRRTSSAPAS